MTPDHFLMRLVKNAGFPVGWRGQTQTPQPDKPAPWKQQLARVQQVMHAGMLEAPAAPAPWPENRRVCYVIQFDATRSGSGLAVDLATRTQKPDGRWDRPKRSKLSRDEWLSAPDPQDREILQMLVGARAAQDYGYYDGYGDDRVDQRFTLDRATFSTVLAAMCRTGRCLLPSMPEDRDPQPVEWDDGLPWVFFVDVVADPKGGGYRVQGTLCRGDERMSLSEAVLVLHAGLVITRQRVALMDHGGAWALMVALREGLAIQVPAKQAWQFLTEMYSLPRPPRLRLPPALSVEEVRPPLSPRLKIKASNRSYDYANRLRGELTFDYGGRLVPADQKTSALFDPQRRSVTLRDASAEQRMLQRLFELGFRQEWGYGSKQELQLSTSKLAKTVRLLTAEGWTVEAEGKLYRRPGEFQVNVSSGIDWFELNASVSFGDQRASLPQLLAALRKGEQTVVLDDGTVGVLPEEWLKKYAVLSGVGKELDGAIRFSKAQVGFLDALLASMPEANCDAIFEQARDQLRRFEGVAAADAPETFVGQLRPYQREGLGWLHFLRQFSFGGCLADDMGLGKTVQVLAMLEARRRDAAGNGAADSRRPSLVVVPRSLVFNWREEAHRFCPGLRVLDHSGVGRTRGTAHLTDYDLVLTTYGTLRRDAAEFKDVHFDYVILDEAQAVKNASTASAKAVRLLRADHRLAMSGTPIENHLGELWSLFDFLNPGMLGSATVFKQLAGGTTAPDAQGRALLATALRPFILRRTKSQVATDLPEKFEQTIVCELDSDQRKLYDELREHYRTSLLSSIEKVGMNKSKIQILEALLRLRQAACHPGLIDKQRCNESSAKLDALLPHLREVLEEGHKALVFSQFTSLLDIVRRPLDEQKITYEYLDGKTRDRQARVERFQTDPDCKLFLISLKAGGLGLNLTAAEYVFLLDPWWNPAVEAQAIDRAHRIGQQRQVFAYRLIARDTVEEKVLLLQQTKRELADAIINSDNGLISRIGREDLELLLG